MSVSSALLKSANLLARLRAMQPVDPLATLSTAQRSYFEAWRIRFFEAHSNPKEPGNLYSAWLARKGWTPYDWLSSPVITEDTSEDEAARVWNDFFQVAKRGN